MSFWCESPVEMSFCSLFSLSSGRLVWDLTSDLFLLLILIPNQYSWTFGTKLGSDNFFFWDLFERGGGESILSWFCTECGTRRRAQSYHPEIMTWAETKSQMFNQLSQAPPDNFFEFHRASSSVSFLNVVLNCMVACFQRFPWFCLLSALFFGGEVKILFYLFMRDTERETEGEAGSLGNPMQGSIPGPRDHTLSWRPLSHPGAPLSSLLSGLFLFFLLPSPYSILVPPPAVSLPGGPLSRRGEPQQSRSGWCTHQGWACTSS